MFTIETARAALEFNVKNASAALKSFPKGPMGLTPDHVKASPEWKATKARYDASFAALRKFNAANKPVRKAR